MSTHAFWFFSCFILFDVEYHSDPLAGLELSVQAKVIFNLNQTSCLCLWNDRIMGPCYHAQVEKYLKTNRVGVEHLLSMCRVLGLTPSTKQRRRRGLKSLGREKPNGIFITVVFCFQCMCLLFMFAPFIQQHKIIPKRIICFY